ncbi:glycosyltransferase [Tissierella pigra]|uniref:glycosyltransferase n=1 Tax=Tissierella pigra TaxID=2607614 RepID=UPI001C10F51C|nr:glycosyltransferase [Tissierella pigra]MBU5427912.1 glycosyltransferase [Tissierella pigra]
MRIVHLDQMFHPEFGDQINILPKYQVKQGHEVYIVTGKSDVSHPRFINFADNSNMDEKDKCYEEKTGVKVIRIDVKKFISGRAIYKRGYKKIIDKLNPDILFCHFNDTIVGMYYTWISNRLNYPVVFDSHMLEMASKNPLNKAFRFFYRMFLTPKIIKNNLIVIRTQDDPYVEKCLGIPLSQAPFISFGTDTDLFKPNNEVRKTFREENDILEDDFVIVYTGKLDESKNGKFLAEAFKDKFYITENNSVVLLVVGNTSGEYGKEVEEIFHQSKNKIIRFPTQRYVDLPQFYQAADLAVFPKQCSLSFYDVQACGLPVVAEDNSINIERCSHGNGFTFKDDDINDLKGQIKKCIDMNSNEYQMLRSNSYNYIKENYDYKYIARLYTEVLEREYKKYKEGENDD